MSKFCMNCGQELDDNASFCFNCGKNTSNNETKEEINNYINKNDKDIKLELNTSDKYINIKLSKKYNVITPGLEKLVKSNIVVEREIYYEK